MKDKSIPEIQYSKSGFTIEGASNIQGIYHCPEKVMFIQDYAFSECKDLTHLFLPERLTDIGMFAFENCSNLNVVYFPENLNYEKLLLGHDAFNGCEKLAYIVIADDKNQSLEKVCSFLPVELQDIVVLKKDLAQYLVDWQLNTQEALMDNLNKDVVEVITKKGLDLHFFKPAPQDSSKINENQPTLENKKP